MLARIPLPVSPTFRRTYSGCVLPQDVRRRPQPKMTTAMVFRLIVPYLDSYEILFTTKCASAFISSTPAILDWWLRQATANRFVVDVWACVLRTSNCTLVRHDPVAVMEVQSTVQFQSSTSLSLVSAAHFTDLENLTCSYCGTQQLGCFSFCLLESLNGIRARGVSVYK